VAARTVGKWVGKVKRTVSGVQREIQEELRLEEIRNKAQANRDAIEGRMAELREEAELMEAPVAPATYDTTVRAEDGLTNKSADLEDTSVETAHAEEPKQQGYK
jgi:sec-independent protein translocase protein TatB